jgi:hypothetical protein
MTDLQLTSHSHHKEGEKEEGGKVKRKETEKQSVLLLDSCE